ncbi:MAG: ABC transporter ATP-binding protein [Firmicutes bacterium]|jgi:branched-chain amino acid transport system ATP-binding protein|nr:ABC transporter ATP-binding protein [Bacillota bacterium]
MLRVHAVTKRFGGLVANDGVELQVKQGQIYGIIGPNGAGKTTLFNCITGFHKVDSGSIEFAGTDITNLPPNRICRLGIARTFQVVQVMDTLTVLENVMVGAFCRTNSVHKARESALAKLDMVQLVDRSNSVAGTLNISQKKRLQIARALATEPKLIMLDEAMAGLTESERHVAVDVVRSIRESGITVVMIEHVMEVVMPVSDRVMVLNFGKKIADDRPEVVAANPEVISAYLGDDHCA